MALGLLSSASSVWNYIQADVENMNDAELEEHARGILNQANEKVMNQRKKHAEQFGQTNPALQDIWTK